MNILQKNDYTIIKRIIFIFYTAGAFIFLIPSTHHFFISITPLVLLLSTCLLIIYHNPPKKKDNIIFSAITISGFFIEVVGVNTGIIFGNYSYGNTLGIKLFNTPLLIAINWLFLTYTSNTISEKISKKTSLQLLIAPTIMLLYDLILEQLAPRMNMWSWRNATIPLQNYIAWWIIGFLFTYSLKIFKIETKNPIAITLFISQFLFFIILHIAFLIKQ